MTKKRAEHNEPEPDGPEEGVKEDPTSATWASSMKPLTGGISIPSTTITPKITSPSTWSTGGTIHIGGGPITVAPSATKPKASKTIAAPGERPKKILIAFLDGDDEVQWCAKVHPDDIDVTMSSSDPATRLNLGVWLIEAD